MRNVPQRMFPRNRLLKYLHREKSHYILFLGFGIFGQSKYPNIVIISVSVSVSVRLRNLSTLPSGYYQKYF